jgi:hypothetical protein
MGDMEGFSFGKREERRLRVRGVREGRLALRDGSMRDGEEWIGWVGCVTGWVVAGVENVDDRAVGVKGKFFCKLLSECALAWMAG